MDEDGSNRYQKNLSVLTTCQPDVAAIVDAIPLPDGVTPMSGRDGSETFLLPTVDGRGRWLGDSSMPEVSSSAIWNGLRGDGRNMVLPGILTGREVGVILERVPEHTALFVCESDPLHLKLAMMLFDYRVQLAEGRLVFLLGDNDQLVDGLVSFFEQHSGYEFPRHLLPIPQHTPAQSTEYQRLVEAAGRTIANSQARSIELTTRRIAASENITTWDQPRIALIGSDAARDAQEHVCRMARAVRRLGWACEVCIPDSPGKCHISARLNAVDHARADLVIQANDDHGVLRSLLPEDLPVVTWLAPGAQILESGRIADRLSRYKRDVVVTSTSEQGDVLKNAGAAARSILLLSPSADDEICEPVDGRPSESPPVQCDAVVLADVPKDDAEPCDIKQASHVALWNAMRDQAVSRIRQGLPIDATTLLDDGERKSGTTLREERVRGHFLRLVELAIVPAAIARAVVDQARVRDFRVHLHGFNGSACAGDRAIDMGSIPVGRKLHDILAGARCVVLPEFSGLFVQHALDALCLGRPVICRTPSVPFTQSYPELCELVTCLYFFTTPNEVPAILRTLDSEETMERCQRGREMVRSRHTLSRRMLAAIRAVQADAPALSQIV